MRLAASNYTPPPGTDPGTAQTLEHVLAQGVTSGTRIALLFAVVVVLVGTALSFLIPVTAPVGRATRPARRWTPTTRWRRSTPTRRWCSSPTERLAAACAVPPTMPAWESRSRMPPGRSAWAPCSSNRCARVNTAIYRRSKGRYGAKFPGAGSPVCLVTTTGRKSGQPRSVPLIYLLRGDDVVIVASKGGMSEHPDWFLNLRDDPKVSIQVGADTADYTARVAGVDGEGGAVARPGGRLRRLQHLPEAHRPRHPRGGLRARLTSGQVPG